MTRISIVTLLSMSWLAAFAAFTATAAEPTLPMTRQQLEELLEETRERHDLPMLAAAVLNDEGPVVVAAVGVRKRGTATKATVDDKVHLGSETKAVTAWLIAVLVEQKKLGWDETLGDLFPDLAQDWPETHRRISVTQLLTHHSGLPANYPGEKGWWEIPVEGAPRDQRTVMMENLGSIELEAQPGEKLIYSNLGYAVIGAIAERRGKAPWEKLVERHIFQPLGMKGVGHGPMGREIVLAQPWQHTAAGEPLAPTLNNDNPPVMGPAGRLHCSLSTWAKFAAEMIRGGRGQGRLKAQTYAALFSTPYDGRFYCRGGWGGQPEIPGRQRLMLSHDGSNTLNYCTAFIIPADNCGVLVATNQGGDRAKTACHEIRNALIAAWTGRRL